MTKYFIRMKVTNQLTEREPDTISGPIIIKINGNLSKLFKVAYFMETVYGFEFLTNTFFYAAQNNVMQISLFLNYKFSLFTQ
jgi:hypothetical protein